MSRTSTFLLVTSLIASSFLFSCSSKPSAKQESKANSAVTVNASASAVVIKTSQAEFSILPSGYLKAALLSNGQQKSLDRDAGSSDGVVVNGKEVSDFTLDLNSAKQSEAKGKLGTGKRIEVTGKSVSTGLEKTVAVEVYDDFPQMAITSAAYKNTGNADLKLDKVVAQRHAFDASLDNKSVKPHELWAFQGSSLEWGKDEIFAMPVKYSEQNPMGRTGKAGNYGGGVPVNAFWTRDVGMAIGHIETLPLVLDMPIRSEAGKPVDAQIDLIEAGTLKPGETFSTPRTFEAVYSGDYYEPLRMYSLALQKEGWKIPKPTNQDYAVAWCGWGYEFNVTPKDMLGTIPELKKLGITWATLDDRWFDTYGDWRPRHETFPDDSMKKMVDEFHKNGIYAQIWWLPIAVEDGQGRWPSHKYIDAQVVKDHPDWLILDKNGKHARITRDLAAMCPAVPEVQEYHKKLTEKFIKEWGFDGHKLDNIYTVPACYNPKHKHKSPNDSINAMAEVYKQIFETTRALKPESVTQSCPCGTTPNIAWLPYMDQAVTADPVGGVQVRQRIKWYKALLGPEAAVYGDHVELSEMSRAGKGDWDEHGRDFASTVGTGGVVGTKFTWPDNDPARKKVALTPDKEQHWKKWIDLYNQKMLSRGTFRNLYVIGYDNPEGYAIEKDGKMYYAFFTKSPDTPFKGEIELRGLPAGKYRAVDYVNNGTLGTVDAANPKFTTEFKGHLLIEAQKL